MCLIIRISIDKVILLCKNKKEWDIMILMDKESCKCFNNSKIMIKWIRIIQLECLNEMQVFKAEVAGIVVLILIIQ